ncbi:DnaA/Hda family protein [Limimaricola cinnabarinus]|jgi:chromosomal replication initiation ATPase DnaA|uniref:Chromosomal replication initiator DnaA n=1 Tax=Limimaricola cinnabarinus TaxID=1125964 RepID=A0A2G1MJ81_9RHOB|nr:DnaA/Hda family protein [Limimaricola cinnabarinus]PHP28819.1 chromosomal replication initiator DnaA [Limimaricola cinnabarinus]
MAWQLSLDLPLAVALGSEDFILSDANRAAHRMVTAMGWPEGKLALTGPPGSGKSHLARLWQATSEAIVVEDIQRLSPAAEETLFHLHNRLAASGGRLLLTADRAPARLDIALPDLASRLQATAVARIADPDDRLLRAVLAKHFADRQLVPMADVIPFLAARIERSFSSAAAVVARLDRLALAEARPVSRALARRALGTSLDIPAGRAR